MRISSDHLQAVGTLAAAIAALIALFVAWDQGRVMRAQQHASVMPILAGSVQIDESEEVFQVSIEVRNDGVGPAFVESARILSGGEPMRTMEEFNTTILPETLRQGARSIRAQDFLGKDCINLASELGMTKTPFSNTGLSFRPSRPHCRWFSKRSNSTAIK